LTSVSEIDPDSALRGLLVLIAAERAERDPESRIATEVLLQRAGFSSTEIGSILDQKPDTVRKRIERAGKGEAKPASSTKQKVEKK
jgi:DNA-directed RNA polymerase specialized sigma24 family protein